MTRAWQLAYDAIAERFVVTDAASGAHVSHATQAEALEALSRISGIDDRRHRDAARGTPLRHARARDRRDRRAAGGGAHAAVLEGLVAQHRVVRLEGAAMIRRWLPFIVGAGFVVWIAALVMLAMTAEGPQRFGELYLVHPAGQRHRRHRAPGPDRRPARGLRARLAPPRAGLAAARPHAPDVRRPRDRAAAARVRVLGHVPDARHRQLVPRRGAPGPHRRARPVARGARPAHARVPRPHRAHRRAARGTVGAARSTSRSTTSCAPPAPRSSWSRARAASPIALQPRGHAARAARPCRPRNC